MNKEIVKKCFISRYDETIKVAPFLTIKIGEVDVVEPKIDDLGHEFAQRLVGACRSKGYIFKFYTKSSLDGFDYELVVY